MTTIAPRGTFTIRRLRLLFLAMLLALVATHTWVMNGRTDRLAAAQASWALAGVDAAQPGTATQMAGFEVVEARRALEGLTRTTWLGAITRVVVGGLAIVLLTGAVARRDRQLEEYAGNLEAMVADRTRALDLRTHGMRLVLDHVDQGLVTVDLQGTMDRERSAVVDRWFGAPATGARFGEMIGAHSPEFAIWFDLGLAGLREGIMPPAVVLAQLPGRFRFGAKLFEVAYSPILEGERIDRVLLIVSDVTARLVRERAERAERERLAVFQRILHDRTGFEEFVDEASELVASLERPADPLTEQRVIHTLKGNSRMYGLEGFAEHCHAIEDELAEGLTRTPLGPDQRERLRASWREVVTRIAPLLGDGARPTVEIERSELSAAIDLADGGVPARELAARLASWAHEPVARRLGRLGEHAQQLAARLGKCPLDVAIRDGGLRLEATRWAPFWRGLVHAVRNAVDHGLEDEDERRAASKPARGLLALSAEATPAGLRLTIVDDGRGIDWSAVRQRAQRVGLPCATDEDLEAALFLDGLTTRDRATATSGRGVGLAALREAVLGLGGTIEVSSQAGAGTTVRCLFPAGGEVVRLRPPSQPLRRHAG